MVYTWWEGDGCGYICIHDRNTCLSNGRGNGSSKSPSDCRERVVPGVSSGGELTVRGQDELCPRVRAQRSDQLPHLSPTERWKSVLETLQ